MLEADYLSINELKSIYHAVFSSHLNYASQMGLIGHQIYRQELQNSKKCCSYNNKSWVQCSSTIYKSLGILKVHDQITLLNCLFAHDFLNGKLPKSFENTFSKLSDVRSTVNTINWKLGCLFLPSVNSSTYGLNSLYRNSIISWTFYVKLFNKEDVVSMSKNELKSKIKKHICYPSIK